MAMTALMTNVCTLVWRFPSTLKVGSRCVFSDCGTRHFCVPGTLSGVQGSDWALLLVGHHLGWLPHKEDEFHYRGRAGWGGRRRRGGCVEVCWAV